jgi:hypothetical protein
LTMNRTSKCLLAAAVLAVAADGLAQDQMQSPSIQANRGQSAAQQSRDADRCMVMARKRSGVDPTVLAANSTPLEQGKGLTSTPIDQPTMAMGSSGAGATGAGTGDMTAGQSGQAGQMGSSGAGMTGSGSGNMGTQDNQMGSSGTAATGSSGQMGSTEAGAMGASGTSGTGATGSSSMGAQASTGGAAGTSGAMGSTGAGGSSGSTGEGHPARAGRGQLAMATADDYNAAFSKCMSSRGYTVGSSSSGGN